MACSASLNGRIDPRYYAYTLCAVSTGLRPGELAGLRWGDVSFAGKTISVKRTFWKGRDYVPKTRARRKTRPSSRREVDVGDQLLSVLGRLARERYPIEGTLDPDVPVFLTPEGARINVNNFRSFTWVPALVRAGVAYRKPMALRHTYATFLLAEGQSPAYVASQMGHSTPMLTLSVYGRWLPRERREAPARLEGLLAAARTEGPARGPVTAGFMQHHATDPAEDASGGETHRTS
jgi:integrase